MLERLAVELPDEAATLQLGAELADALEPGFKLYVSGELGAGKTTLLRGLLRRAGVTVRIKSPTYTLVESYNLSSLYFYHFDFYRFNHPNEWEDAGFRDIFGSDAVCLVEWPEKAVAILPPPDLRIELIPTHTGRTAHLTGLSGRGRHCLGKLKQHKPKQP